MTYEQILEDIYNRFPAFSKVGGVALKEGLGNIEAIDERLGHPHREFKTIHVAGTNGKGSVSHSIAAVLQAAGYVVGLYTSPHLVDFRERIRVDGCMIDKDEVVRFMDNHDMFMYDLKPSFFEITTGMAMDYFRRMGVEVAVIEVGLGGRLDSTNIITPDLSVITNIGLDHTQYLGDTLEKIAEEKAGIIKQGRPVVIGERHPETEGVFIKAAERAEAPIVFAEDVLHLLSCTDNGEHLKAEIEHVSGMKFTANFSLRGLCQRKNLLTILAAIDELRAIGYEIADGDIRNGLAHVQELTGLQGRWQKISSGPDVIVDTGHNEHGVRLIAQQLEEVKKDYKQIHIVWGMCADKNPEDVVRLLPRDARYYFTQAHTKRAMPAADLYEMGLAQNLNCHFYPTVEMAYNRALRSAEAGDLVFVGGSNFVVAEVL
jgi:dihydrofolate synthase/folylpolyglutamate synthase